MDYIGRVRSNLRELSVTIFRIYEISSEKGQKINLIMNSSDVKELPAGVYEFS